MPLEIKDRRDLTIVPIHILSNPTLSFELKGVAAMLYSFEGLHGTTEELATILGVSDPRQPHIFANYRTQVMRTFLGCTNTVNPMIKRRNVAQPI